MFALGFVIGLTCGIVICVFREGGVKIDCDDGYDDEYYDDQALTYKRYMV